MPVGEEETLTIDELKEEMNSRRDEIEQRTDEGVQRGRVRSWLSDLRVRVTHFLEKVAHRRPKYDKEFIADLEINHLDDASVNGRRCLRCRLCGRVYAPRNIESAMDHIVTHSEHIGTDVEALSNHHVMQQDQFPNDRLD